MFHILVFHIDQQQIAIELSKVQRVIWIVEINGLPNAPDICKGVINMQGRTIPVIDLRKVFGYPPKELALSDQLVICHTASAEYALYIDGVKGVIECEKQEITSAKELFSNMAHVAGIYHLNNDIIYLYSLESIPAILNAEREVVYDKK